MINVWFGRSREEKNMIVVREEKIVDWVEVAEFGHLQSVPVYEAELQRWLDKLDMSFSKFSMEKSDIPKAEELYRAFILATEEDVVDEEKTEQLKEVFLSFVEKKQVK